MLKYLYAQSMVYTVHDVCSSICMPKVWCIQYMMTYLYAQSMVYTVHDDIHVCSSICMPKVWCIQYMMTYAQVSVCPKYGVYSTWWHMLKYLYAQSMVYTVHDDIYAQVSVCPKYGVYSTWWHMLKYLYAQVSVCPKYGVYSTWWHMLNYLYAQSMVYTVHDDICSSICMPKVWCIQYMMTYAQLSVCPKYGVYSTWWHMLKYLYAQSMVYTVHDDICSIICMPKVWCIQYMMTYAQVSVCPKYGVYSTWWHMLKYLYAQSMVYTVHDDICSIICMPKYGVYSTWWHMGHSQLKCSKTRFSCRQHSNRIFHSLELVRNHLNVYNTSWGLSLL